ncbi:MAG TPA: DUF2235 domain-containing protein [Longimicrobium sp.]|nr:DUF2235 domain-containing protein [Longimicrobium sp.]
MSETIIPACAGKNIVICCDGTSNQLDGEFSNVAKLYSVLVKDPARQVVYYDPGVGTMGDSRLVSGVARAVSKGLGMAFGAGFAENLSDAYAFLMDTYEEGDCVYMFGFSRGAFTVRALAAILHTCGLVEKRNQNLLPYIFPLHMKSFEGTRDEERAGKAADDAEATGGNTPQGGELPDDRGAPAPSVLPARRGRVTGSQAAARFKSIYSRPVWPHYLGVWDTVTSLGWVYRRTYYPFSTYNPDVRIVRHAVSIDERRAQFRSNLWHRAVGQDVRQVWFAGVHSDVGGGYPEVESGLSKIPLAWIAAEAHQAGLLIDPAKYDQVVLGKGGQYVPPDPAAMQHSSLKGPWWALEYLPGRGPRKQTPLRLPLARRRTLPRGSIVHQSVYDRMAAVPDYHPANLFDANGQPLKFKVEPYPAPPFY